MDETRLQHITVISYFIHYILRPEHISMTPEVKQM